MTRISQNYTNVNFKAIEQVQTKKAEVTNVKSKHESKSKSNVMKMALGLGALGVITIAGLAIKNKNVVKKAETSFENLAHNIECKKVDQVDYGVVLDDVRAFFANSSFKPNPSSQYKMCMMSPQKTKEFVDIATQKGDVAFKDLKLSENSFMCSILEDDKRISTIIYDAEKIYDSIFDCFGKNDDIFIKPITFKKNSF